MTQRSGVPGANEPAIPQFAFYGDAELLILWIAQIGVNVTDVAEILDRGTETTDGAVTSGLKRRRAGQNISDRVIARDLRPRESKRVHEGRQEPAIRNGVQENEIIGDAVATANDRLAAAGIPGKSEARARVVIGVEVRPACVKAAQWTGA